MSNSTADDETKLKDFVIESLATSGILSDFKGKLGVEIAKALVTDLDNSSAEDQLPKTETFQKLESHLQTGEGALALYLIQDTLEYLELYCTCTILKTEMGGDWNLFTHKSKNDLNQLLSPFNLQGTLSDSEKVNGSTVAADQNNPNTKKPIKQPLLIELIGKMLRGEITSNRNSFSNETFVKSSASEITTSVEARTESGCSTFSETK